MHQLHDDIIWMPEQRYMDVAHLKMKAPEALSGQSSRVSSAQPPPPTRCSGQDTRMSRTACSPGSSTILSPGLQRSALRGLFRGKPLQKA